MSYLKCFNLFPHFHIFHNLEIQCENICDYNLYDLNMIMIWNLHDVFFLSIDNPKYNTYR